jgi:O-antigen ligase
MLRRLSLPNSQFSIFLHRFARQVEWPVAVTATLGLGVVLGKAMASPSQETVTSLAGLLAFFVLLVADPKIGLLTWLVLYPFLGESISINLGAGLPDLTLTRFCVAFLTVTLLAQIATHQRPMFKITKVDMAALAFFLALGASTLAANDPVWAFQYSLDRYFVPLLMYFIARNLTDSRQDVEWLLNALLILSFYSAIYLIYEHLIVGTKVSADYGYAVRIVRGLLGGPHVFGLVFTMALPFTVQRYLETQQPTKRMLYLALVGLFLVGIFLTYKRGTWLSAVVSFLVLQFMHPRFRRFFLVLLIVASLVLIFAGDQLTDSAAAERLNDDLETGNNRTNIWEEVIELWKKRPIFGYGFDQFRYLSDEYGAVENFYLFILVSVGIVGLLPFLALLLFVVRDSAMIYRQSKRAANSALFVDWEMIAVFGGAITSWLVKGFTGNNPDALPNFIFFLLIGAIVESQVSRLSASKPTAMDN